MGEDTHDNNTECRILDVNQFTELPTEVWSLTGLTGLDAYCSFDLIDLILVGDLEHNLFTSIPTQIGRLTGLTHLTNHWNIHQAQIT